MPLQDKSKNDLVALCEEGVDRNLIASNIWSALNVALCEEGVDRNSAVSADRGDELMSPSAKRAWIEIARRRPAPPGGGRPLRRGRG